MTREEIIKIFEENHIAEGNATINATKLAEIFTKHEADLLKEFVEYLKNKYTKSEKEQLEIYNVYLKEDNRLKSNFHDGCRFGFELARTSMDQNLERFLEEKK